MSTQQSECDNNTFPGGGQWIFKCRWRALLARLFIFLPSEKGGDQSVSQEKRDWGQTGTKWHKQDKFLWHKFWGGEACCPLFIVCYSSRPHPRTFAEGRGTTARPPDGDARSGGRLEMGRCPGANAVASVLRPPCDWNHIRRSRCCGPILLSLPRSLSAAAPLPHSPTLLFLARSEQCFCIHHGVSVMIIS